MLPGLALVTSMLTMERERCSPRASKTLTSGAAWQGLFTVCRLAPAAAHVECSYVLIVNPRAMATPDIAWFFSKGSWRKPGARRGRGCFDVGLSLSC